MSKDEDQLEKIRDILSSDELKVVQLTRELKEIAREQIGQREARFLVDAYYQVQETRKRTSNRKLADQMGDDAPLPIIEWVHKYVARLEERIRRLMEHYSEGHPVGEWSLSIDGIGPVLSAGLLAHVDITKADTVGSIWRFAGLDPSIKWYSAAEGRKMAKDMVDGSVATTEELAAIAERLNTPLHNFKKRLRHVTDTEEDPQPKRSLVASAIAVRPHNAKLRTLCWKIGESFVKVSGNQDAVYGQVYAERKALEVERNEAGRFEEQALARAEKNPTHKQVSTYKKGKLPDAHIHARAKRYAVKLFLAHWHHVAYEVYHGEEPPKPYIIEHGGHTHFIKPPKW